MRYSSLTPAEQRTVLAARAAEEAAAAERRATAAAQAQAGSPLLSRTPAWPSLENQLASVNREIDSLTCHRTYLLAQLADAKKPT